MNPNRNMDYICQCGDPYCLGCADFSEDYECDLCGEIGEDVEDRWLEGQYIGKLCISCGLQYQESGIGG